jgi:DNA-binding NarL/FixJ family response regulator
MTDLPVIRVLIGEDQHIVREGLALILSQDPGVEVVGQAANGREAVQLFALHRPDVTLLDLRMPVLDGVGATEEIVARAPDARILILTTFDGDADIHRALTAGAKGYLLKDATAETLLDAVRQIAAGNAYLSPVIASRLMSRMRAPELTERELQVLEQMADGKSNREIGAALFIAEGTVKLHVNNLFAKLGVTSRVEAVTLALRRGLVRLP